METLPRLVGRAGALSLLLGLALALALGSGGTARAATRHNCGSALGGSYTLDRKGSTCRRPRQVLHRFDHQVRTGMRHLVRGGRRMVDSQLPFRVYTWRRGGLTGHIVCMRGHWTTANPPTRGHPWLDAILRY
jgi:hypothetical protein